MLRLLTDREWLQWLKNGIYHNRYGPVIVFNNGTRFLAVNNKFHRLDGPAKTWANGSVEYWINDSEYTYLEYLIEKEIVAQYNYIPNLKND